MILSWEEVVREYESMNRTSRATKYLKIWGNILASAYRLNPIEADKMWQSLIELNVEIDESNGKFFVAQIFTTITDNLTGEEAADFLLANQYRTELFLKYRLGYHWSYVEFLVAFYIKNGLIDKAFDFLQLCHSISGNGGLLQEDKDINNLLVSVVSRGLNLSTGSHRYRVIKVKKGQFIDFLARCQECFEGSLLGLVAETYLMISKYIDLKPGSHIRDILLVLSQKELTTAFFDLIYFVRNSINDKIILGTLTQYIQNHNFEVLTRRREDADELDVKQRWLLDYFCNHDELEFLHLSKKEKRCFSDFDTEYMVNLLLQKKYGLFVYFVLEYFKSSEERSWDDCGETLIMSIMDVMEHGYRSSDTIVIYSSHPLGTPEERYGVLFPLYKADYSQLQFIINFVKFIYNNISNIV